MGIISTCGCIAVVPYNPDTTLVDQMGAESAKKELQQLMTSAVEPTIGLVEVTDDFIHYRWNQSTVGMFYQTVTNSIDVQIFFTNLHRIELYENHNVFLWGPGDSRVDKIRFATADEARRFADIVMSLRAKRLAGASSS